MHHLADKHSDQLIPFAAARAAVGLSRSKIYQLIAQGLFPLPIKIGRKTCFSAMEVQNWISEQRRARGGAYAR